MSHETESAGSRPPIPINPPAPIGREPVAPDVPAGAAEAAELTALSAGRRIRELRLKRDWTAARLAEEIGVSRSYISRLENETRRVNLDLLEKVARALDVDPSYFTEGASAGKELERARAELRHVTEELLGRVRLNPEFVSRYVEVTFALAFPDDPALRTLRDWEPRFFAPDADEQVERLIEVDELVAEWPEKQERLAAAGPEADYRAFRAVQLERVRAWGAEERLAHLRRNLPHVLLHRERYEALVGLPLFLTPGDGAAPAVTLAAPAAPAALAAAHAPAEAGVPFVRDAEAPETAGRRFTLLAGLEPGRYLAYTVRDEALEPRHPAGTVLILDPAAEPRPGDRVVARTMDGELLCRVWQPSGGRDGQVRLVALNPQVPPRELPAAELAAVYPVVRSVGE